jgi:hypothetical protein
VPCSVGFCLDEKTYIREMKALHVKEFSPFILPGADATVHHFENPKTLPVSLVCVDGSVKRSMASFAGLIAHEAVHVLQEVKRAMRETEPGAEWEAYTVQFILIEILHAWKKVR